MGIVNKFPSKSGGGVYGVVWDGTSTTAWDRTDDAAEFDDPVPYVMGSTDYGSPFDDISPWKDMNIVEDAEAGTLVSIPKFWYKLEQVGNGMSIKIANESKSGFHVSPAHMDRGDGYGERDVVYIGRYHCAYSGRVLKSKSGTSPSGSNNRSSYRTNIHAAGSTIWQMDFAMRFTIWLLYLVEFADWNSQLKIGYGFGSSSKKNNGYTDSMPYHTGTIYASRTASGVSTQYRNIEGLWDNLDDYIDGCYLSNSILYIIINPNAYSDNTGGISVGLQVNGYPTAFNVLNIDGTFPMFIPSAADTSSSGQTKYTCDAWWGSTGGSSGWVVHGGGYYDGSLASGLFYISGRNASNAVGWIGSRLMKLP